MRIQNYDYLKDFPFQHIERLWNFGQLCRIWWDYYCWEWRNSTARFSNLAQEWEGKPAPGPKPKDNTNGEPEDLCMYCGEFVPHNVRVNDRGELLHPGCQLCRDYDDRDCDFSFPM